MNKVRLLSTAAALLTIGTATALAQAPDKPGPERAPAAQRSAPPDKIAPPMNAGQAKPADPAMKPETTGQAPAAPGPRSSDMKPDNKATQPPQRDGAPSATTGQGTGRGAAQLSTEQRSKISAVIRQQKVQPVNINISVSVGTRVPQNVRYYPLPAEVVTIYPQWRGFDYIIVGSTIVVIDPGTREIVAILEA